MAAAQPVQLSAPGDDIADWMAQRWRDVTKLGPEAQAMGRQLWAQATNSGQDVAAPNPSDVRALDARALGQGVQSQPSVSQQQTDLSQTFVPSAGTPTLQALREQQAQFGQVRNKLDIQNAPYALPVLLPAALLAWEVPAALGVRGLLSAGAKAFDFPELDSWLVPAAPEAESGESFPCRRAGPPCAGERRYLGIRHECRCSSQLAGALFGGLPECRSKSPCQPLGPAQAISPNRIEHVGRFRTQPGRADTDPSRSHGP